MLKTSVPGRPVVSAVEQGYVLCLVKKSDFGLFYAAHSRITIFQHKTVTHLFFGSGHGLGMGKAILSKTRIKKCHCSRIYAQRIDRKIWFSENMI
ncbi:MAG: hypothetical protein GY928_25530 [Colwellia sp.]|nr:hypothetical protein [Colwellia sp.]